MSETIFILSRNFSKECPDACLEVSKDDFVYKFKFVVPLTKKYGSFGIIENVKRLQYEARGYFELTNV